MWCNKPAVPWNGVEYNTKPGETISQMYQAVTAAYITSKAATAVKPIASGQTD